MVAFGERIVAAQAAEWKNYYLDYNYLKNFLSPLKEGNHDEAANVTDDFRAELDKEVEKVVLFLLQQQGEIARRLASLSLSKTLVETDSVGAEGGRLASVLSETEDLLHQYRAVGEELLSLVHFLELNVTAVRKILKKHDKKSTSLKLSRRYLSAYTGDSDSHLHQLYHYGGLSALYTSLSTSLIELRMMQRYLEKKVTGFSNHATHSRVRSEPIILAKMTSNEAVVLADDWRAEDIQSIRSANRARVNSMASSIIVKEEDILDRIYVARRRLKHSTNYVEMVAAQALMFDDGVSDDDLEIPGTPGEHYKERSWSENISSFLNLCSTCLYMTNYYIIAPTSGAYADKLGSSEALAGIIIGMTPNAALVATVLYGWWSNHSYKNALCFAAGCSLCGNIFYALALQYDSLTMVMIGRFLNGFGSARAINRRFIADTFSRSERTAASAAFVTSGALGMALGPALAAILSNITERGNLWTVETSPGWVMFVLWSIFFVSALLFFKEPDRSHIFKSSFTSAEKKVELVGETQSLLSSDAKYGNGESNQSIPLTKRAKPSLLRNVPVMMTLLLYFVLKLVLECLLSSSATITRIYFDWTSQECGIFLAILGLLMFPANFVVAGCSRHYDDRQIIMFSLIVMLVGVFGILSYDDEHYSSFQYITFGIVIFLSTNALEGPNMSLLSKTIPKAWAKGTFNSGFLATEAGTAARSVGDLMISFVAGYIGFEALLNCTFMPLGLLILFSITLTRKYYSRLVDVDDED